MTPECKLMAIVKAQAYGHSQGVKHFNKITKATVFT